MDFEEFKTELVRRGKKRDFKVRGSYGVYDTYKAIRKNGWYDIGRPLTEHEFYIIVRSVNKLLAENIAKGETVTFPSKMGTLELRKFERKVGIKDGKLRIGYPIDWNSTLRLWYEDEEAHKEKILVRFEDKYAFRMKYDKFNATYENKIFYEFTLHNKVKRALKENIKKGITDTLW